MALTVCEALFYMFYICLLISSSITHFADKNSLVKRLKPCRRSHSVFIPSSCYNKLPPTCLKEQRFIILQFWRLEVHNRSHWAKNPVSAGLPWFWRLQEGLCFLAFSCFNFTLFGPSPPLVHLQSQQGPSLSFSDPISLMLTSLLPAFMVKDPVLTSGPPG